MGQYFRLINYDKQEYVDPWDLGGVAKLWEWCANNQCRILPFLLRKSNSSGGGDIELDNNYETAGRWAGDKIALVGDYDDSRDFHRAEKKFANISKQVAKEFNNFIGVIAYKLKPKR